MLTSTDSIGTSFENFIEHSGLHYSGRNAINVDVYIPQLVSEDLSKTNQASLSSRVGAEVRPGAGCASAGQVHNLSIAALVHVRNQELAQRDWREQVHSNGVFPIVDFVHPKRADGAKRCGVVHQGGDRFEFTCSSAYKI